MIGKIIGGMLGSKAAKQTRGGIDGPMGAVLGVVATTALKRLSFPAMIALTAGGFVAKKFFDGQEAEKKLARTDTAGTRGA